MLRFAFLLLVLAPLAHPYPAFGKGETIWGANRKETLKAMNEIKTALGVRCKYCHIRSHSMETPNKEIARLMHFAFVDSLSKNGRADLFVEEAGTRRTVRVDKQISAEYRAEGDEAGIHLRVVAADSTTYEHRVPLPADRAQIDCATCHNGQVYFMTAPKE